MPESEVHLRIDFKGKEAKRFLYVQKHLGLKNSTEVVRHLIQKEAKTLGHPRFELINCDTNGAKVHDRELKYVPQIYFKPEGLLCEWCRKATCPHIEYALAQPEVQIHIRKRRKEGWNLPEV